MEALNFLDLELSCCLFARRFVDKAMLDFPSLEGSDHGLGKLLQKSTCFTKS